MAPGLVQPEQLEQRGAHAVHIRSCGSYGSSAARLADGSGIAGPFSLANRRDIFVPLPAKTLPQARGRERDMPRAGQGLAPREFSRELGEGTVSLTFVGGLGAAKFFASHRGFAEKLPV